VPGQLPADDPPRPHVDHEGEEHDALPATQVAKVRHPEPIGARRGEVAVHAVGRPDGGRVRGSGAPRLAPALGAPDALGAHQPLDAVTTDVDARPLELKPRPPVAVAVIVGRLHGLDLAEQPLVSDRPR
jgi:hypothetical protein